MSQLAAGPEPRTLPVFVQWGDDGPTGPPVTGYTAWYDATQITAADGSAVSSWADLSGNGYNLNQGASGQQPKFYSSTTANMINGHPAVFFNSAAPSSMHTAGSLPFNSLPFTFCGVVRTTANTSTYEILDGNMIRVYVGSSSLYGYFNGGTVNTASMGTIAHTVTAVLTAGSSTVRIDGAGATATLSGAPTANPLYAGTFHDGTSIPWNGPFGELIIYTGVTLTTPQLQSVEVYLKAKWGTP